MQPGACAGSCHARCAAQMWGCAPWHPPLFSCGLWLDTTSEQCWNSWADLELIEALKTEAGANLALIKPSEKWGRTTSAASFIPPCHHLMHGTCCWLQHGCFHHCLGYLVQVSLLSARLGIWAFLCVPALPGMGQEFGKLLSST